ncbi:MAG: hypothetical protein HYX72_01310 [Acidobacteria bacterium]|nr:hypothetical protein [Acidobacteriota bacterium]
MRFCARSTLSVVEVGTPTGTVQSPLLFLGPNQINFQIPPGIAPGTAVPAQLTRPDGTTLLSTVNITATSLGIFTQPGRLIRRCCRGRPLRRVGILWC